MSQSLSRILIHLIFSTKDRQPILGSIQKELHAYLATVLNDKKCLAIKVGGSLDHVHLFFVLARTEALSNIVAEIKIASSKWLKNQSKDLETFHWQNGYGCFSVSQSGIKQVVHYIENQEEHHRTCSFQEEFRKFLIRHEVPFDERYVWD